jgi:Carboxypeptidase regulatory-like domain
MMTTRLIVLAILGLHGGGESQSKAETSPPRSVQGVVLGPLGHPAVGVEVWATIYPAIETRVSRSRTDGDGMYVLGRLPENGTVWVFARAKDTTLATTVARFTEGARAGTAELRLWDAASVSGTVVDSAGKPITGAELVGTKDFTWFEGNFWADRQTTDAKGRFKLTGIPIGKYAIRVSAKGFAILEHEGVNFGMASVPLVMSRGMGPALDVRVAGLSAEEAGAVRLNLSPMRHGGGFKVPASLGAITLKPDGTCRINGLFDAEWSITPRSPSHSRTGSWRW